MAKPGEPPMAALRIFSYLPNPRIWKATITGRLCDVEIEVRALPPTRCPNGSGTSTPGRSAKCRPMCWPRRHASAESGLRIGRFTRPRPFSRRSPLAPFRPPSARLGQERFPIYGHDAYESARIDGFLDAGLVFARDGQIYLLALRDGAVSSELHARMAEAFVTYLSGIEQALAPQRSFLVGDNITLADICFVAELCLFHNERARRSTLEAAGLPLLLDDQFAKAYPRSANHFQRLLVHPGFVPDVGGYLERIELSARPQQQCQTRMP